VILTNLIIVLDSVQSGGANLNESFLNGSVITVPFGGVGQSGMGCYKGRASFDAFSHRRTVASTPSWLEKLLRIRYMPYNLNELQRLRRIAGPTPNFDRNGEKIKGTVYWAGLIFGLGAGNVKGAVTRWVLALFLWSAVSLKGASWKVTWGQTA
jgi:beta-apo-4'-carotenal oxygenase